MGNLIYFNTLDKHLGDKGVVVNYMIEKEDNAGRESNKELGGDSLQLLDAILVNAGDCCVMWRSIFPTASLGAKEEKAWQG